MYRIEYNEDLQEWRVVRGELAISSHETFENAETAIIRTMNEHIATMRVYSVQEQGALVVNTTQFSVAFGEFHRFALKLKDLFAQPAKPINGEVNAIRFTDRELTSGDYPDICIQVWDGATGKVAQFSDEQMALLQTFFTAGLRGVLND